MLTLHRAAETPCVRIGCTPVSYRALSGPTICCSTLASLPLRSSMARTAYKASSRTLPTPPNAHTPLSLHPARLSTSSPHPTRFLSTWSIYRYALPQPGHMLVHISSPPEGCACWRDVPLSPPGKNQLRARFAQGCVTARRHSRPSATCTCFRCDNFNLDLTLSRLSSKVRVVAATKRCARRDCRRRRVLHRGAAPPRLAHPGGSCETDLSTSNRQGV